MVLRHSISRRSRRRGAVLVVVLVAITLLVGLIFFVVNMGEQLNRRVRMQAAADAAAISGAGWLARTMNLVANNNVTQARLLALVAVMDSLPVAAEMTLAEETGDDCLTDALEKYEFVGGQFTPYERNNFFRRGLSEIYRQMNPGDSTHLDLLADLDETYDESNERGTEGGYEMCESTKWTNCEGDRGRIWQAMLALDAFSQAATDSVGHLAQLNADNFGRDGGATAVLAVPILPDLPLRRRDFDAFRPVIEDHLRYGRNRNSGEDIRVLESSRLVERLRNTSDTAREARIIRVRGGAIPQLAFDYRLGPFTRLYRWRDYWDQYESDYARTYVDRWGYTSYGPLEQMLRRVVWNIGLAGSHAGTLDTSRFAMHLRTLAQVKAAYMLGLESPVAVQYADRWISDYAEANEFAEQDAERRRDEPRDENGAQPKSNIMTTRYYRVHVKSTIPWDNTNWMLLSAWQEGEATLDFVPRRWWSWQLNGRGPYTDPTEQPLYRWISDSIGWRPIGNAVSYGDYQRLRAAGVPVGRWVEMSSSGDAWFIKRQSQVIYDRELGLRERVRRDENGDPVLDANGQPVYEPYTIYHVELRVFGGIEIRDEFELSNPLAGADRDSLPAPTTLDLSLGDYDPTDPSHLSDYRQTYFAVMGAATVPGRARVWNQRFHSGNPTGQVLAVAQAMVFNNKSWDAWTQDWRAQLVPVENLETWTQRLAAGEADIGETSLTDEELQAILEFLQSIEPQWAEQFLRH